MLWLIDTDGDADGDVTKILLPSSVIIKSPSTSFHSILSLLGDALTEALGDASRDALIDADGDADTDTLGDIEGDADIDALGDTDAEALRDADGLDSSKILLPSSFNSASPSSLRRTSGLAIDGDADADALGEIDGLMLALWLIETDAEVLGDADIETLGDGDGLGSVGAEMTYPIVALESSAIVKLTAGIVSPAVVSRFLIPIVALTAPISVVLTSVHPAGDAGGDALGEIGSASTPRKTTTLPALFTHCHVGVLASVIPVMSSCPPTPDESMGFVLSNSSAGTLITLAAHCSPALAVTVKFPETCEPDPIQ